MKICIFGADGRTGVEVVKYAKSKGYDVVAFVYSDTSNNYVKPRGSFADSVAKETEVNQELLDPSIVLGTKTTGIQRI